MKNIAKINNMNNEYYTPESYIKVIKNVMGNIDIDLASCEEANKFVKAKKYYTFEDQSQHIDWCSKSRLFLNPPYDKQIQDFAERYTQSKIKECIVLVNSATGTKWFHKFLNYSNMVAFTNHRISFYDGNKKQFMTSNNKAQAFFYRGDNITKFANEFRKMGCHVCTVVFNKL